MSDKIEKIEKISKLGKAAKTGGVSEVEDLQRMSPNKEHFDTLMNTQQAEKAASSTEKIDPLSKTSLMDEVRNLNQKVDNISKVSPRELVAQTDEVIRHMDDIKQKLATPNLELKPSTQTVLQNKLTHIDENLRVALSKAGLEYAPSEHLENKSVNPIERFLGFLTNGQAELGSMSREIEMMHLNNKEISPANMLRIQMKVGYISQEIEFFSAVLNKALDSTKTIMNIQV
jgi:hypothetical protein